MVNLTPDVYVHLVDFGITSADEVVRKNADETYTILLNSRSASNRQKDAYHHAMGHITEGDFENMGLSVQALELVRHES